ncbi:MAG: hypothetical protein FWG12_05350 [Holophagaceae bacterium]|nr:hypothetical protein [Holophagaceae bacterium]
MKKLRSLFFGTLLVAVANLFTSVLIANTPINYSDNAVEDIVAEDYSNDDCPDTMYFQNHQTGEWQDCYLYSTYPFPVPPPPDDHYGFWSMGVMCLYSCNG